MAYDSIQQDKENKFDNATISTMKTLSVPQYFQTENTNICHLVCLQMVLAYYRERVELKDIIQEMGDYYSKDLVHSEGAAIVAARRGYKSSYHFHDLEIIDQDLYGLDGNDRQRLRNYLNDGPGTEERNWDYRSSKLRVLAEAMETGVEIKTSVPSFSLIEREIANKTPVIASVRAGALYHNLSNSNHSVVVVGIDNNKVWINDPGAKLEGLENPYCIPKNDFILGWYQVSARTTIISKNSS